MYCDLNLRSGFLGERTKNQQLIQLITSCMEDNYQAIAINYHFKDTTLQLADSCKFQAYDQEYLSQRLAQSSNISQAQKSIQQLSRITLDVSDNKFLNQVRDDNKILQSYDLIAVKCRTEKQFLQLCNDHDYYDIVTFDCFDKLPFIPKLNIIQQFLKKDIMFELNYSDALQDANKRRAFISNASIIINATKGKNIIFSSDADHWLYHRSPYDLVALGVTLGMKKDQATHAVKDNPSKAIKHAIQRKAYKGTITEATAAEIEQFAQKRKKVCQSKSVFEKLK